jgi:hypothetical protein
MGVAYFTSGRGSGTKPPSFRIFTEDNVRFGYYSIGVAPPRQRGYQAVTNPPSKPRKAPTSVSRRS